MSVGSGATSTVTCRGCARSARAAHVSEKIVVPARGRSFASRSRAWRRSSRPDAVQLAAFDELHVKVVAAPLMTLLCEALIDAVGGGSRSR